MSIETKFGGAVPILYCSDIKATIDHFVNVLEWSLDWDWGDPVELRVGESRRRLHLPLP